MSRCVFYPFYPERILWVGMAALSGAVAIGAAFLVFWLDAQPLSHPWTSAKKNAIRSDGGDLSFSLNLKEMPITFSLPRLESEMTFSFDLPRPDGRERNSDLFIRFKQSVQSKKISLPCRIDLQFIGNKLAFVEQESPFWLELSSDSEGRIQGVVWIETAFKENMEVERFFATPQASPLRGAQEFAEGSPFRILGEAQWLGHDVFAEKYRGIQTLLIAMGAQPNPQILGIREKDWIVWNGENWGKGTLNEKSVAIARIESTDSKGLILEGWDGDTHVRLSLLPTTPSAFKMRGEEIFNSIRVRSEKQISCMIEKQCLILRSGDWVLKVNGRWKILRKKEEKEAYQSGKIKGELFVFEKIESKQGQKFISGLLFNGEKSQVIPVDLAANKNPTRKEAKDR